MVGKTIAAASESAPSVRAALSHVSGRISSHHAPARVSSRRDFVSTALDSASAFAIMAALLAVQSKPVVAAACPTGSNLAVTVVCTGPAVLTGGTITNSGSIGIGTIGISVGSGTSVSSLSNAATGTIDVYTQRSVRAYGVRNYRGTIATLTNTNLIRASSTIAGTVTGINSDGGSIGTLTNAGTIIASSSVEGGAHAVDFSQSTIGTLVNSGSMHATVNGLFNYAVGLSIARSTVAGLTNSGTITALGLAGANATGFIVRETAFGTLTNNGMLRMDGGRAGQAIYSDNAVTSEIINNGTINTSAQASGWAQGVYLKGGQIGKFVNNGMMDGLAGSLGLANGLYVLGGSINSLTNNGTITVAAGAGGKANGIFSRQGTINTLVNMGAIIATPPDGGSGFGINNNTGASIGVIGTLTNAQGGSSSTLGSLGSLSVLTYTGNLPGTYIEYISSRTHYGQLAAVSVVGTIGTFGIAEGSSLSNGTFDNVLMGVGSIIAGSSTSITGSIGTGTWELVYDGSSWDLIVDGIISGPDSVNTLIELGYTREEILNALRHRAALANQALNYDCMTFDKNGVCIALNFRDTSTHDMQSGAGVIIGAVKLSETTRLGVFVDHAGQQDPIGGLAFGDEKPMFGGFIGYSEKPDGTGLQARASANYHTSDITTTRNITLSDTEPGTGRSRLTNWAIAGEIGYGVALSKQMLVTPYVGLRYGAAERAGYTEDSSPDVEYPMTFHGYGQNITTATAGLRLSGMFDSKLSYILAAGIEYDVLIDASAFAGVSTISGLENFVIGDPNNSKKLRGNGLAAIGYTFAPNQRLTASVSVREETYTDKPVTHVMFGVEFGF